MTPNTAFSNPFAGRINIMRQFIPRLGLLDWHSSHLKQVLTTGQIAGWMLNYSKELPTTIKGINSFIHLHVEHQMVTRHSSKFFSTLNVQPFCNN
jgi:hypothetical protein